MKTLVIAEKPSAAIDIRKGLEKYGSFKKLDWGFESDQYVITWLVGHVLSLKEPQDYPDWDKKWENNTLPWFPPNNQYEYKENEKTKDVFKKVSAFMKRKDISLIINACDAEREGDLIFWELYDYLKLNTPVKRFWESASLTPNVVQHVIEHDLKDESFYGPRREAAYARAFADLLLGMNFTVGFTVKAKRLLTMGRVQTPTLAILVQRKQEIENFKPEDYFEIEASFQNEHGQYKGMWFKKELSETRFGKKEEAEAIVSKIQGKKGKVIKKDVKKEEEKHKLLYSLTTLQQEANKKFGFTATKTLEVAQKLYETHKILSYPRSESEVLGSEHVKKLEPTLKAINIGEYASFATHILNTGIKITDRFINDKKLTDHHAIVPMDVKPDLSALSSDEKKIYDLVVKRFLSVFYPAAQYEKTEIVTEVEGETFKTSGRIEIDPGWKVVYGKEADDEEDNKKEKEDKLPIINKDEESDVIRVQLHSKKTQPPKHYNENTLLGVMKNPKKFLDDKELQEAMASTEAGLGTPATRAAIIENLVHRGYVERKGKQLIATTLGEQLVSVCPDELKSPEITADWEQKLRDVSLGDMTKDEFMSQIEEYVKKNIHALQNSTLGVNFAKSNGTIIGKCPVCRSDFLEREKSFSCASSTKENPCIGLPKHFAGKTITTNQVKLLIEKGKTNMIKGFKSKAGKKFDAMLELKDGKIQFSFGNEAKETELSCPVCNGKMIENDKFYTCENSTKENPCLGIPKVVASKKLTLAHVKQILDKGETEPISGFKSKKGTNFSAKLKRNDKRLEFEFVSNQKETSLKCPLCGGSIVQNDKAFGCSNWKEKNCQFRIWSTIAGKKLNEKIVTELIANKETKQKIDGFTSKSGKLFSAKLKLNDKNQVEFVFE